VRSCSARSETAGAFIPGADAGSVGNVADPPRRTSVGEPATSGQNPRRIEHESAKDSRQNEQDRESEGQELEGENERQGGWLYHQQVRVPAANGLNRLAPSFPTLPVSVSKRRPVRTRGEVRMNRPKTSAKTNKTAKAKAKSLKVKTNVKAGGAHSFLPPGPC
jgi:hypothetical protein